MKQFSSNLFAPSTMTLLGGFVIIFATTLALRSMTLDQTGNSIATVSMAFRSEFKGTGSDFEVIPINNTDLNLPVKRPVAAGDRFTISTKDVHVSADRTDEFENLLSELQRVAGSASAGQPFREVTIDFTSAEPGLQSDAFRQACDLLDVLAPSARSMHFEIRQWAASPTTAAWIDSVQAARVHRTKLRAYLSARIKPPFAISSSAALWPHADRIRPELTVIVRHAVAHHSDDNVPDLQRRN